MGTNEGLGLLARRLVHLVLAVVLKLHSRRESVRGLRTGVSATGNRGPHTDVKDEGAVVPGFPSPGVGSAGGGVGRRPEVACQWVEPRRWPEMARLQPSPVTRVSGG